MLPGKVPPEKLKEIVFNHLGAEGERVLIPPRVGIDASAIDFGERILVATSDPITGASKHIGFYAVNVNANDVAVMGAKPKWFLATILLPEYADEGLLREIMEDLDRSAKKLGVAIIGGHTEITVGLDRPIVLGTMLGETTKDKLISAANARAGDRIILTKGLAIEGTSIIAGEREEELKKEFGVKFVEEAKGFLWKISVVKDAMIASSIGVHAMHDPTEGGVANSLHEIADASNLGFRVYYDNMLIADETKKICEYFDLNPLALISSGALLISASPEKAGEIVNALKKAGIESSIIGEFIDNPEKRVIVKEGKEYPLEQPETDEVWKLF